MDMAIAIEGILPKEPHSLMLKLRENYGKFLSESA